MYIILFFKNDYISKSRRHAIVFWVVVVEVAGSTRLTDPPSPALTFGTRQTFCQTRFVEHRLAILTLKQAKFSFFFNLTVVIIVIQIEFYIIFIQVFLTYIEIHIKFCSVSRV